MPIVGQQWGRLQASSDTEPVSVSQTIKLNNRNISAEIALSFVLKGSKGGATHVGDAMISQIVSNAGVEQPGFSVIGRSGTTSITFTLLVFNGTTTARWIINHWE